MPNPYPVIWQLADILNTRLDGELTFTDPSNQPGGGSGSVDSVTAGDASITVAGTVANPTVAVAALGITAAKIALLAITDAQIATANKDGASATPSMRTLGTGAAQATAGNDPRLSDSRPPTGAAGGDLTGTYPNPTLAAAGGGAAGPIGDATHVAVVTVDAKGRITALSSVAISGVPPAGAAGGDLSGTYPNPTTAALNGVAITNAPVLGQVLTATSATAAQWAAGGSGISVAYGTSFPASPATGDLAVIVDSTTAPTFQWLFRYNGSSTNTDKWEFVGGSQLGLSWDAGLFATGSTTYAQLSSRKFVTLPVGGVFAISFGANSFVSSTALIPSWLTVRLGAVAASDTDGVRSWVNNNVNSVGTMARTMVRSGLAAAVLELYQRTGAVSGGTTVTYENGWLSVTPIRCS